MEKLVIPIEMTGQQALDELRKLGASGQQSGKDIEKGAQDATTAHNELASALRRVNVESMAISAGKQMLDLLSQGAIQASQDLKRMAEEFVNLRDRARELAGVLGKPGNIEFTKEQVQFAADTGFAEPARAVDFRTAFQGEANQYKDRFANEKEFEEFEKAAARLGNKSGVAPDVMAKLAGTVIRTGPDKGQTSQDLMQTLGGALSTQMAGSGGISQLAGQLGRMSGLIGPGRAFGDIGEAATSTRMAAETNLPEAYTWATEMRAGVVELAVDKDQTRAKELGITAETTNFDAIKRLSEGQSASGENIDVYLRKLFPQKRIADAFRDSITAYRKGVMAKGLKDANSVVKGQAEAETAAFYADPLQGGMLDVEKANTKLAEAELGEDRATIAPYMQRAKTGLAATEANPMAKMWVGAMDKMSGWWRGTQGQGYQGFEQMETAAAMGDVRRQAGAVGIDTSDAPSVATAPQREVERYMAELVRLTKERVDQGKAAAQKPLAAPAPEPAARP